jgi:hypothetical protein
VTGHTPATRLRLCPEGVESHVRLGVWPLSTELGTTPEGAELVLYGSQEVPGRFDETGGYQPGSLEPKGWSPDMGYVPLMMMLQPGRSSPQNVSRHSLCFDHCRLDRDVLSLRLGPQWDTHQPLVLRSAEEQESHEVSVWPLTTAEPTGCRHPPRGRLLCLRTWFVMTGCANMNHFDGSSQNVSLTKIVFPIAGIVICSVCLRLCARSRWRNVSNGSDEWSGVCVQRCCQ